MKHILLENISNNIKQNSSNNKTKLFYLDILRILAVFLVIYGHFISVGMRATEIPNIIKDAPLPLLQPNCLENFEFFLINVFHTQTALVGVSIFFLVTGYLMPLMMKKYTRLQFLVNRAFRIYPTLIISSIIIGIAVYFSQGIVFSLKNYLATMTLTLPIIHTNTMVVVIWTLIVEVIFYFICAIIGKYNWKKLLALEIFLWTFLILIVKLNLLDHDFYVFHTKFILMILVGTSIFLSEEFSKFWQKLLIIVPAFLSAYFSFIFSMNFLKDNSNYNQISTHLLVIGLFLLLRFLFNKVNYEKLSQIFIIRGLADLVYPLYLLHCSIGLTAILILRDHLPQLPGRTYIILTAALLIVIILSSVVHILVEKPGIQLGRFVVQKIKEHSNKV